MRGHALLHLIRVERWSLRLVLAEVAEGELIQILAILVLPVFETHSLLERAVRAELTLFCA